MIKEIIKYQIRSSRDKNVVVDILEGVFKQNKNKTISKQIREFHKNFTKVLVDNMSEKFKHGDNISRWRWHTIFDESQGEYISYYRKDSYLLADAPFIFKPVMAVLKPNLNEYQSYYGVDLEGVKLLIENHVVWPEVHHIREYQNNVKILENLCKQIIPYYVDTLEDSMAIYWINNIIDKSKLPADIRDKIDSYMKNPEEKDFKYFINGIYFPYIKKQYPKISSLIENIPSECFPGSPPLYYKNLRDAVVERLMKVSLLSECLSKITQEPCINISNVVNDLEKIQKNDSCYRPRAV